MLSITSSITLSHLAKTKELPKNKKIILLLLSTACILMAMLFLGLLLKVQ